MPHIFEFTEPRPIIPSSAATFLLSNGLPKTFRVPELELTIRFASTATRLTDLWEKQVSSMWSMPLLWGQYWHIGAAEYTQFDDWICIEEISGRVLLVSMENDNLVTEINSSIQTFARSMRAMFEWYQRTSGLVRERKLLRIIYDQICENESLSQYWKDILMYADDYCLDRISIEME